MKKLITISGLIVVICLITSFLILPNIKSASTNDATSSIVSSSLTYVIKNFNGSVAVFEEGNDKPFKITGVSVNTLPYADQEVLKNGIIVNSQSELTRLLEDYCS